MIRCPNPKCNLLYRENAPDTCSCCGADLKKSKIEESDNQIEESDNQIDKLLDGIVCSRCGSPDLKLRFENNLHTGIIECKNCNHADIREFENGKAGKLPRCDWCGTIRTEIIQTLYGYSKPLWSYTGFNYIDNMTLCQKCFEGHYRELEEKEEKMKYEKPVIEYMFDGDALKFWRLGDDGVDFEEIEVDNDDGKQRYDKVIRKMKRRFPKKTKFIEIDN